MYFHNMNRIDSPLVGTARIVEGGKLPTTEAKKAFLVENFRGLGEYRSIRLEDSETATCV